MSKLLWNAVRAETIAELILERAGPIILRFFTGIRELSDSFQ